MAARGGNTPALQPAQTCASWPTPPPPTPPPWPHTGHRSAKGESLPLKRGMLHYAHSRGIPVQVVMTAGKEHVVNEAVPHAGYNQPVITSYGKVGWHGWGWRCCFVGGGRRHAANSSQADMRRQRVAHRLPLSCPLTADGSARRQPPSLPCALLRSLPCHHRPLPSSCVRWRVQVVHPKAYGADFEAFCLDLQADWDAQWAAVFSATPAGVRRRRR